MVKTVFFGTETMIKPSFSLIFAVFCLILSVSAVQADPKPWLWSWSIGHWDRLDFENRYIYDMKTPQLNQFRKHDWSPEIWAEENEGADERLRALYAAGILADQFIEDDIPVLQVGPRFFDLSYHDQQRIVAFVDATFGVTDLEENGMFYLYGYEHKRPIGVYNKSGLILQ